MENESEIIKRVLEGKKDAYEVIVKKYMKKAYFIALGFVENQQDAMDLSQDAFIKAYRSLPGFDTTKEFFPWFYTILKNLCLNFIKKRNRRERIPIQEITPHSEREDEKIVIKKLLWESISELPIEEKETILLRYFQGFSYSEISDILDCPIGTVMSRLYYAKKKLCKKLGGVIK